jgi:hypothetical protein
MTNIQPEMGSQGLVKLSTMSHGSTCFELHLGEAVEDLTRAQVPVLALEPNPIVEGRGIAQREALQELQGLFQSGENRQALLA